MNEYEVLVETINPCGGSRHASKEFIDVEADSPEQYVLQNGRYPILDVTVKPEGDTVVTTGDQAGNIIRYTFSE
mgnify:CR=1 FL=1